MLKNTFNFSSRFHLTSSFEWSTILSVTYFSSPIGVSPPRVPPFLRAHVFSCLPTSAIPPFSLVGTLAPDSSHILLRYKRLCNLPLRSTMVICDTTDTQNGPSVTGPGDAFCLWVREIRPAQIQNSQALWFSSKAGFNFRNILHIFGPSAFPYLLSVSTIQFVAATYEGTLFSW